MTQRKMRNYFAEIQIIKNENSNYQSESDLTVLLQDCIKVNLSDAQKVTKDVTDKYGPR